MKYWVISLVFAALSVVNVALNIKYEYMDDGVSRMRGQVTQKWN